MYSMLNAKALCLLLIFQFTCWCSVHASAGDTDPAYRACISSEKQICEQREWGQVYSFYPLSIINWSCYDQVRFKCIRAHNNERMSQKLALFKYNGHWCFERYFGLEEPGSVLFSALNILPHVHYLSHYGNQKGKGRIVKDMWLVAYAVAGINGWVASTIFHAKKSQVHITYDYTSALVFLAFGLLLAVRRVFSDTVDKRLLNLITFVGATLLGYRINDMILGRVSFDSHMRLCISIVAATTALWVLWVLYLYWLERYYNCQTINMHIRWRNIACQVWLIIASALELFDFPAFYGVFDAHALWHAATVPLGFLWFQVWIEDGLDQAVTWSGQQQKEQKV